VVPGYGPVPAPWARDLLRGNGGSETMRRPSQPSQPSQPSEPAEAEVFVRRLFTHPHTGELVAMESRSKTFPPGLRDQLITRDQVCRTPWCDALVRHADHATGVAEGGATDRDNGQGLCEGCNYAKTAPGWRAGPAPGSSLGCHLIQTRTPSGHFYESRPPPLPGAPPPRPSPAWRSRARWPDETAGLDIAFLDHLGSWDPTRHAA
jgi:5-methylcytosine-specific restriction endonuclease McrA